MRRAQRSKRSRWRRLARQTAHSSKSFDLVCLQGLELKTTGPCTISQKREDADRAARVFDNKEEAVRESAEYMREHGGTDVSSEPGSLILLGKLPNQRLQRCVAPGNY